MLKKYLSVISISSCIFLAGCATNASFERMTYMIPTSSDQKPKNPKLIRNITVANVEGGHETNPLWTSQINNENFKKALEVSLHDANLYAVNSKQPSRYQLSANLISIDQPLIGFDLTVNSKIHYELNDLKLNKIIYSKDINSTHTATVSDSFIAIDRLKIANEGSGKNSIKQLINELYQIPPQK